MDGIPSVCPLYCFALGASLANMAPFRVLRAFLAWFGGFVWVCLVCVLCADCVGFCARVELGGLKTCGVFAFRFLLLSCLNLFDSRLFLFAFVDLVVLLLVLSFLSGFVFVVVSFSLTDVQTKRKGAIPCVLSRPIRVLKYCRYSQI